MIEYDTRPYFGLQVLSHLYGSVIPRSLPWACVGAVYSHVLTNNTDVDDDEELFRHPYPVQIFAVVLGFLLVIRSQLAYQRFWEGRTALAQCFSKWLDAATQLVTFDEIGKDPWGEAGCIFRLQMLHLMSLLHATLMEVLRKDTEHGHRLGISTADCFGFYNDSVKEAADQKSSYISYRELLREGIKVFHSTDEAKDTDFLRRTIATSSLQRKEIDSCSHTSRSSLFLSNSELVTPLESEVELSATEIKQRVGLRYWWSSLFVTSSPTTVHKIIESRKFFVIGGVSAEEEDALCGCDARARTVMVMAWIHRLACKRCAEGGLAVPPPVLSRTYQVLSDGMLGCVQAIKVAYTPFPFPWVQLTTVLMISFIMIVPLVVGGFVIDVYVRNSLVFVIVLGYSALNEIARELENPFGHDPNNLPLFSYQKEYNLSLLTLLRPAVPGTKYPVGHC